MIGSSVSPGALGDDDLVGVAVGEVGGVDRLGEGADLVHLPQQRVGRVLGDPPAQPLRVGDEEVVADDLDPALRGQPGEPGEVLLVERVLDRDHVEVADQLEVELDHRVGVAASRRRARRSRLAVVVVGRGAVEAVAEAAVVTGVGDRLVQQAERLLRARDRRGVAALVAGVEGALAVALEQDLGEREVDLGRDLQRLEDRVGADRDHDELLEVEVVGGVLAAVDQVDQRAPAARGRWRSGPGRAGCRPPRRAHARRRARRRGSRWRRAATCRRLPSSSISETSSARCSGSGAADQHRGDLAGDVARPRRARRSRRSGRRRRAARRPRSTRSSARRGRRRCRSPRPRARRRPGRSAGRGSRGPHAPGSPRSCDRSRYWLHSQDYLLGIRPVAGCEGATQVLDRLAQVLAEELVGALRIGVDDRGEQRGVLVGDLGRMLVVRAQLDHAELDLGLDLAVRAREARAGGGVDDRPVKSHVGLDDLAPGGAVGNRGEVLDGLAGALGDAARRRSRSEPPRSRARSAA